MTRSLTRLGTAACLLVGLAACASYGIDEANPFRSEQDYRTQRAAAVGALADVVGTPTAGDVASCRAVAVGEQACGGPADFRVYSIETAQPARVEDAAARVTRLDRRANAQFDFVSTCALLIEPPLALSDGICVADL